MTQAVRFLNSFGRALSMSSLYRESHPTLEHALDAAWTDLQDLLAVARQPTFTFLGGNVLFGDVPLSDRRRWEWSGRLSDCGVQRVQFEAPIDRERFVAFLLDVSARVAGHPSPSALARPGAPGGIRLGAVGLRDAAPQPTRPSAPRRWPSRWTTRSTRRGGCSKRFAIATRFRCSRSRRSSARCRWRCTPTRRCSCRSCNCGSSTSTRRRIRSTCRCSRWAWPNGWGWRPGDVRAYGVAGLLHDIGKTQVPLDILNKPGRLTESERQAMNRHPADGARLILESNRNLELAAVVAYEHHIMIDGGGYPQFRYRRPCHDASRLIHVCDVFDALRTHRPYRDAWPLERTCAYLRERVGVEFDEDLVEPFVAMINEGGVPLTEIEPASHA